jgi:hypothetical protein
MKLSIKRAFYKDLAPNNLHLKIRSFRKRKDYIRNIEFETVMISWINSGRRQNLWFHFQLDGRLLDIIIEHSDGVKFIREALAPDKVITYELIPQEVRGWLLFNMDLLR